MVITDTLQEADRHLQLLRGLVSVVWAEDMQLAERLDHIFGERGPHHQKSLGPEERSTEHVTAGAAVRPPKEPGVWTSALVEQLEGADGVHQW